MITVFTPTYNRGYTLPKLYESLQCQTFHDFEWVIIDDGSTDNTSSLVGAWIKENVLPRPITYIYQVNSGKHRAINKGVQIAKGEAFFIVDSDDYLEEDALRIVHHYFSQIQRNSTFAGIAANCKYPDGKIVGQSFDGEFVDATSLERQKYGIKGDKAEVFKTALLKKYPFPEFDGEKFLSEAVVWNHIAFDGYLIRWINDCIYVCEYRNDGLSYNLRKNYRNNPYGYIHYVSQEIRFHRVMFPRRNILIGRCFNTLKGTKLNRSKFAAVMKVSMFEVFFSEIVFKLYKVLRIIIRKGKLDE